MMSEEDDAFLATKPGRTRPADSEEAPEAAGEGGHDKDENKELARHG